MRICQTSIRSLGDNLFDVKSEDGEERYKVSLGSEDELPYCECKKYQKTHLPCKHFGAVFRHIPDISWNSLPPFYREHPMLTVDEDCLSISTEQPNLKAQIPSQCNGDVPILANPTVEVDNSSFILREAKKAREQLSRIHSLTFIVESMENLKKLSHDLKQIENQLLEAAPKSDGLLLEPGKQTKFKIKFKALAKRRKKKLGIFFSFVLLTHFLWRRSTSCDFLNKNASSSFPQFS